MEDSNKNRGRGGVCRCVIHYGGGVKPLRNRCVKGGGGGQKRAIFCVITKWMPPYILWAGWAFWGGWAGYTDLKS